MTVYSNGPFTTRPVIRGTFGCVAATHWLAAATGMRMLEKGGNAFDAAAATGFALQVLEPHLNGPAGEVPILFFDAEEARAGVLCGQGSAPAAASIAHFESLGLDAVPGTGMLPACVPGAFGAWLRLVADRGRLLLGDILEPAIEYAGGGFPITQRVAATIDSMRPHFETEWTTSAAVYLPDGKAPKAGQLFRNAALAETYGRIVSECRGGTRAQEIERAEGLWYRGFVAEAIERACREAVLDSSGRRHEGLLTADDLAGWSATYEAPLARDHDGHTVLKCGPWTQGPTFLQWLGLLEGAGIEEMDPAGADFVHTMVEAGKLALADRDVWLGDSDAPVDALLSEDYLAVRRKLIGDTASTSFTPGSPAGRAPILPPLHDTAGAGAASVAGAGEPTFGKAPVGPGDTCQISVVDRDGNMVSATSSGGWFQSSPVIPELGFPLNTRGQMFWLTEGLPASLAPGKRPRTTLTPSMVLKDGAPFLGFGTPGGDQQEQWTIAFLLRHLHHGLNLQAAIDAPSFHTGHHIASFWPRTISLGSLKLEGRFAPDVIAALRDRGHLVDVVDDWSLSRICACSRTPDEGGGHILSAAASPRGTQDYAAGR